jgi:hypothetical protein
VWDQASARARHVSLSHVLTPDARVFPRLKGGTGGFASFTALCPANWLHGVRPVDAAEAPLPYNAQRLVWNETKGVRERTAACDKLKGKQSMN